MNAQPSMFPDLVKDSKPKVVGALSPNTPQQKLLFAELGATYRAMGRRPPKKFLTIQQKTAFQSAAEELGGEYPGLLGQALEVGCTSMAGMLRYLQKCTQSRAVSDQEQGTVVSMPWVD